MFEIRKILVDAEVSWFELILEVATGYENTIDPLIHVQILGIGEWIANLRKEYSHLDGGTVVFLWE